MKNTLLKTIGAMALAILMTMFAQISMFAQDKTDEQQNGEQTRENLFGQIGGGSLEGTWDAQVTIRNCQTGAAIRTFASLDTFMNGGTLIDSTSGIPQALRTPGHGVWSQTNGNTFRFSFKTFSFDASGNFTGWQIIRHEANLILPQTIPQNRADKFESAGTSEVYAPNGNLVFTGCSTTIATRFE